MYTLTGHNLKPTKNEANGKNQIYVISGVGMDAICNYDGIFGRAD